MSWYRNFNGINTSILGLARYCKHMYNLCWMVHYEENIKERQWLSEDNGSKTSQISWKINKEVS